MAWHEVQPDPQAMPVLEHAHEHSRLVVFADAFVEVDLDATADAGRIRVSIGGAGVGSLPASAVPPGTTASGRLRRRRPGAAPALAVAAPPEARSGTAV